MSFSQAWNLAFPQGMWVLLVVTAAMCSIGFFKFVWFLSVGYGFAILGAGATLIIKYGFDMPLGALIQSILFIIYGFRLGGFLLIREIKSQSYRKTLVSTTKPMPFFVKFFIWATVAVLYVMQVSPVYYRLENGIANNTMAFVGSAVMAIALIIESVADAQKSAAKKINPKRFCDSGLYRIVRCPNYFGEVLFWTGVFISGFGALHGAVQWAVNAIAYISIIYVMLSGAKRLEGRQKKNYSSMADFQSYIKKTPLIFPLLPLYSLENAKFIK